MLRRTPTWPLLAVVALLLIACGDAVEVAVEEPPAPAPASDSGTEPSASPGPAAPAGEDTRADGRSAGADGRPAGPPPPAAGDGTGGTGGRVTTADQDPGPAGDAGDRDATGRAGAQAAEADADADNGGAGTGTDTNAGALSDGSGQAQADRQAIAIARPAGGSEHGKGPVTAEGEATVYEGTVLLTLVDPDGSVVEEAFTTASAGAPERGQWSHTFATVADVPGRWRVVAAATDPSDGEGGPPARAEAVFRVTGS